MLVQVGLCGIVVNAAWQCRGSRAAFGVKDAVPQACLSSAYAHGHLADLAAHGCTDTPCMRDEGTKPHLDNVLDMVAIIMRCHRKGDRHFHPIRSH